MNFGQRLRMLRTEKNMTQEELGKLMNVGKASVSLYEKNERTPDQQTLMKTADYFDVSVDYLLGRSNERTLGKSNAVDLADKNVIMSFEGRPIPPEDIELMRRLLRGSKKDDE